MKFKEQINNPWKNLLWLFVGMVVAVVIGFSADLHQSTGHGGFIPLIYPPVVAVFAVLVYLLSRVFIRKYNWIITGIAIIYMIIDAIMFYIK
jgi:ABC-type molybdate transport system permease subunit